MTNAVIMLFVTCHSNSKIEHTFVTSKINNMEGLNENERRAIIAEFYVKNHHLKKSFTVNHFYAMNVPKRTIYDICQRVDSSKSEQKKKLRQLSENEFAPSNGLEIIIDDESFFTLDGSDTANNRHYYCKSGQVVDTEVYFKRKKKFVSKVLVWVAISPRGHSAAYICPSGNSVNAQIYEKYCIRSRLRRFINDKHADGQFIFWPDMATAHYAGSVIQAYNELQIKYIEKSRNVPNVPQLRPIERFWRHLKREVYSGGWEASTTDELKARIRQKLRQIPSTVYVHMMRRVKTKIRQASRHGADFVI